jgi:hypothetical protein
MFPWKRLSGFFVRCVLWYALLLAPWPRVMEAYRTVFRAAGNRVFQSVGRGGSVSFEPRTDIDHTGDTTLVFTKVRHYRASTDMQINSAYVGYRPTAFLVALVLASPVPRSRRFVALLAGLVLVSVFVAARVGLQVIDVFSNNDAMALYWPSSWTKQALHAGVLILFRAPAGHYMIPMLIWMVVIYRRGDLRALLDPPRAAEHAGGSG